jgi:D-psicose/D-tagatose/L-ribulose 3-epimerase
MRLAVSSIGWSLGQDAQVVSILNEENVRYVELAPTKLWPDIIKNNPNAVTDEQIANELKIWKYNDIEPIAMQSMLFLRPDLTIFENTETRERTYNYLVEFIKLSSRMGIERMVFGSPKNRQRGSMDIDTANAIAVDFFKRIGEKAEKHGVVFCLEPNAPQYACDYATNAEEGANLVRAVNSNGFKLHLDAACMALAGDDLEKSIKSYKDLLAHYHISSPMLEQVELRDDVNHVAAAGALRDVEYNGVVSIEMRPGLSDEDNLQRIKLAVQSAKKLYAL